MRATDDASRARRVVYGSVFLTVMGSSSVAPILPDIQGAFALAASSVVLTTAVWGAVRLVVDLPLGRAAKRMPPRRMFLIGAGLSALGAAISAVAPSFDVLLLGRGVEGAGASFIAVSAVVQLLALSDPARRGRTLGLFNAAVQAALAASPIASGTVAALWGWHASFVLSALLATAGGLLFLRFGRARERTPSAPRPAAADRVAPSPASAPPRLSRWLLLSVNFSTFVVFFIVGAAAQTAVPLFGADELHLDVGAIGLILGVASAIRLVVTLAGADLSDRFGRERVLAPSLVATAVVLLLFPFATSLPLFALATVVLSVSRVGNAIPLAQLGDHLGERDSSRHVSVNRFVADLAWVLGPLTAGIVIERLGFGAAFAVIAVVVLMAVAFIGVNQLSQRRLGRGRDSVTS